MTAVLSYFGITDKGARDSNFDRIMVNGEIAASGALQGDCTAVTAVVCDGVGNNQGSDEAAEIAAGIFAELSGVAPEKDAVNPIIDKASNAIAEERIGSPHKENMASTVAGIIISDNNILIFNVGDSKVFRLRDGIVSELSTEHSLAQTLVDTGAYKSRDDVPDADKHTIERALGDPDRHAPSFEGGMGRAFEDDVYLLCSDGLSDVISAQDIKDVLETESSPQSKGETLLSLAEQRQTTDNISIIIVEVS